MKSAEKRVYVFLGTKLNRKSLGVGIQKMFPRVFNKFYCRFNNEDFRFQNEDIVVSLTTKMQEKNNIN